MVQDKWLSLSPNINHFFLEFGLYRSSICGTTQSLGLVYVHPPTPTWDDILLGGAIILVIGTFFAQTGSCLSPCTVCGHGIVAASSFLPPMLTLSALSCPSNTTYLPLFFGCSHHNLTRCVGWGENFWPDVRLPLFTLSSICPDRVLSCLTLHHDFMMEYLPVLRVGSFVHITGYFSHILPSSAFAIEIDDF